MINSLNRGVVGKGFMMGVQSYLSRLAGLGELECPSRTGKVVLIRRLYGRAALGQTDLQSRRGVCDTSYSN